MSVQLEKEYHTYLSHLDELAATHLDEYVLIKDNNIIGFYPSYEDALRAGLEKFGNVAFFIKAVKEQEEVHYFQQRIS